MARTHDGLVENLPVQSLSSQAAWDKSKDTQPQGSTWNVENLIDALNAKVRLPAPKVAVP
jgi:hypothetical protein